MNDCGIADVKLWLLFLSMQIVVGYSSSCWNCDEFNRNSATACAQFPKDCGSCKRGCIEDESDPIVCSCLEIEGKPPPRIISEEESRIELPCRFNSPVYCTWEYNRQLLLIGGDSRYQFTSSETNEDNPYNDCSLTISNVSPQDAGQWRCCNKADSNLDSISSDFVTIEVTQKKHDISSPNYHNKGNVLDKIYQEPIILYSNIEVQGKELILTNSALSGHKTHQLLRCRTNVVASKITWEINDEVIEENHHTNEEYLSILKIKDRVGNFLGHLMAICTVTYDSDIIKSSGIDIVYDFTSNYENLETKSSILENKEKSSSAKFSPSLPNAFIAAAVIYYCGFR